MRNNILIYSTTMKMFTLSDINECADNPCKHNSTCIDEVGQYRCKCQGKWKGRHCTLTKSQCDRATCRNGGACTDLGNNFKCSCPTGWRGISCQIREYRWLMINDICQICCVSF